MMLQLHCLATELPQLPVDFCQVSNLLGILQTLFAKFKSSRLNRVIQTKRFPTVAARTAATSEERREAPPESKYMSHLAAALVWTI